MNPPSAAARLRDIEDEPLGVSTSTEGFGRVPTHIGIIMDGNGRWAEGRRLPRVEGHRKGVEALRQAVRDVGERGIKCLTLFAFSSENWKRPQAEVRDLLMLLRLFIKRDLGELKANGVKVRVIGERDDLAPDIRELLEHAEAVTRDGRNLYLNIAFNYGGRDEIVRAARKLADQAAKGVLDANSITPELFAGALDTSGMPDPDLIIRTSGEMRLSNFLLWQAAYAEFVFMDTLWPDFNAAALDDALEAFRCRDRRFGGRVTTANAAIG
ncbi:MAG: isoprenyl transferase [Pseudomonadota bacterium]